MVWVCLVAPLSQSRDQIDENLCPWVDLIRVLQTAEMTGDDDEQRVQSSLLNRK
jgi:hypothetical protein